MKPGRNLLLVIAGPTSVGKTSFGIELAKRFQTEIVSADSRQVYKGMEIGTAAPTNEEKREVIHHLVSFRDPDEHLNAAQYGELANSVLNSLFARNQFAVMVGGSGLFINAVTKGFHDLPSEDPAIRQELESMLDSKGVDALAEELKSLDPDYFSVVDSKNPRRLIRALEIIRITGKPYSRLISKPRQRNQNFDVLQVGLTMDKDDLFDRIGKRVDHMIDSGLIEEVDKLKPLKNYKALNTVGYSEIFDFLEGSSTLEEAIDQIKLNTRKFAKRQMTWFKKDQEINWFNPEENVKALSWIEKRANG